MSRHAADEGRLLFVGNLPEDIRERDIDDIFYKYGRIRHIEIKRPARPPPFAFVEFNDRRDAADAVYGRDGYDFYGHRLRVEIAKGRGRGGGDGGRSSGREFRAPNTGFRVLVRNLPSSASWQDLKDFIKQVVKPAYTNVTRERDSAVGVVEFDSFDDMDRAIRSLDDAEFNNKFDTARVRLVEDRDGGRDRDDRGGHGRGRSPRRRSPDRSPQRARERSRSNERGDDRDRDYDRGRSPPRSHPVELDRSPAEDYDRRDDEPRGHDEPL